MVFGYNQALKVTLYSDSNCLEPIPTVKFENGICNGNRGKVTCVDNNQALFETYNDKSCQGDKTSIGKLLGDGKSCNTFSDPTTGNSISFIVDCINLKAEADLNSLGTGDGHKNGNIKSNTIILLTIIVLIHILLINIFF